MRGQPIMIFILLILTEWHDTRGGEYVPPLGPGSATGPRGVQARTRLASRSRELPWATWRPRRPRRRQGRRTGGQRVFPHNIYVKKNKKNIAYINIILNKIKKHVIAYLSVTSLNHYPNLFLSYFKMSYNFIQLFITNKTHTPIWHMPISAISASNDSALITFQNFQI